MKLSENGRACASIQISPDASEPVRYAAQELSHFLSQICGDTFPVSTGHMEKTGPEILVGTSPRTDALDITGEILALGQEGTLIRVVDDNLVLGGNGRGALYCVYSFLEDCLGVRFFTPNDTYVPEQPTMEIADHTDCTYHPVLEYRDPHIGEMMHYPDFAVRRRANGWSVPFEAQHGGSVRYADGFFVHTVTKLLPPDQYFDEHPEYYALRDGERLREKTQLCLSNPEVVSLVIERVKEELRRQPDATIFSVSQDDNYNVCTCDKCRAIDEEEGSHAGTMIRFVNQVAEAIEEEFPNVVIDTLAYQFTRTPPKKTKPRKNVCVRLCTIECCFIHPLRECRTDDPDAPMPNGEVSLAEDIIGWSKICDRLYIWDYVTNFSHYWMPHPNFHVLADNIRFFVEHGAKGIFEQGCPAPNGGEMTNLRAYIISKCLWNPNTDEQKAADEFLTYLYGPAAPLMKEYMETVYHAALDKGCHLYCFNHPDKPWHTMELVEQCESLFNRMEDTASSPAILWRIRRERMAVRYLRILLTEKGSDERARLLDAFERDVKTYGVDQLWEHGTMEFCLDVLRGNKEPGYWWGK